MLVLVTGGSGSGKSAYAEMRAVQLFRGASDTEEEIVPRLVYLATMYNDPEDPETAARIARHRAMRAGKGFCTVERPSRISEAEIEARDTVLCEDLPNLLANELYRERNSHPERIAEELRSLAGHCANLVIVTGILDCDGGQYDAYTMSYIRALSEIHAQIAEEADEVTEVVAGIPVRVK